jgi:hypothetical protein
VFQFKATHRTFQSTALDWLVISGDIARLEGTGTINGAGSYRFLVAASGGGRGAGKVRIRIWDQATGAVVYDTQPGAPFNAAPASPIHGRITLHVKHQHQQHRRGTRTAAVTTVPAGPRPHLRAARNQSN